MCGTLIVRFHTIFHTFKLRDNVLVPLWNDALIPLRGDPMVPFVLRASDHGLSSRYRLFGIRSGLFDARCDSGMGEKSLESGENVRFKDKASVFIEPSA